MGIRGLTTFVAQNSGLSFDPYRLQNCQLVIDGNSVASQLYAREFGKSKKGHCAYGGNYDEYARAVKKFFCQLACCNVKSIVIFDGGKEPRKQVTVLSRIKGNIIAAGNTTPYNCSDCPLPLLMFDVFKWIAAQSNATVLQCDFEADEEIAALSRALSCPLLSFDSDFYVHAVPYYIPFPTLSSKLTEETIEPYQGNRSGRNVNRYIECSAFNVNKFLSRTDIGEWRKKSRGSKNILQVQVLPLVAALLGNDYVKPKTFRPFFSQIQLPKNNTRSIQQRKILGLLEWLRSQESLDSAIIKILNHSKKGKREYLEKLIRQTVDVYVGCPSHLLHRINISSEIERKINLPQAMNKNEGITDHECEKNTDAASIEENVDNPVSTSSDNDPINPEIADDMEDHSIDEDNSVSEESCSFSEDDDLGEEDDNLQWNEKINQLPDWFLERYRKCELPPCFMDIMMNRTYICPPQVEDQSQQHSHAISTTILRAILRILTPENDQPLTCLTRINRHAGTLMLDPLPIQPLWPLPENILSMPSVNRLEVLLQALNLFSENEDENKVRKLALKSLPSDWCLMALCLAYWQRFSLQQRTDERYLIAACFCIVILRVVDIRAGPPGQKSQKVRREKKENLKKDVHESKITDKNTEKYKPSGEEVHDSDKLLVGGKCDLDKTKPSIMSLKADCLTEQESRQNVKQLLQLVDNNECVKVSGCDGQIFRMRQIDGETDRSIGGRISHRSKPSSFNISSVHVFAELQSTLMHVSYLNSLLGEPLLSCALHACFSGTLMYNAHYQAHGRLHNSKHPVWRSLLGISAPSLENIMDEFYKCVCRLACGKFNIEYNVTRKNTKRKRNKKCIIKSEPNQHYKEIERDGDCDDILLDPENKFSMLGLID